MDILTIVLTIGGVIIGALASFLITYFFMKKSTPSKKKIKELVLKSNLKDWDSNDLEGIYVFNLDTDLTIRREKLERSREFAEKWMNNFADRNGMTSYHYIWYRNSLIFVVYAVSVDGDRCTIPLPSPKDLSIDKFQYKLGKILNLIYNSSNTYYNFDNYLKRAKIKIRKS